MPSKTITTSNNISILDSVIVADLCAGKFFVDATASTFIGAGASSLLGARVKIVNPYDAIVKDYGIGFDIADVSADVYELSMPTRAGAYQTGIYQITVQVEDADHQKYEVTKSVNVCQPNKQSNLLKYGTVGAKLTAMCNAGKLLVQVNAVPTYNGLLSTSAERLFTLEYPTGTVPPMDTEEISFTTYLFDGTYKLYGDVCASYFAQDRITYKVKYTLRVSQEVRCTLDQCCIAQKFKELHDRTKEDCTTKEREQTASIAVELLMLYHGATLASACGDDPSEYIMGMERLLNCRCTLNPDEGVPLGSVTPSQDFIIEGCNIDVDETGFTTKYTINNFQYVVDIDENGNALVVSEPTIDGCVVTTKLTFNIQVVYNQIKNIINNDPAEQNFFSQVINNSLNTITLNGLGLTPEQWNAMSFAEKIQYIISAIQACCSCTAQIESHSYVVNGDDLQIIWAVSNAFAVDVFIDDNFMTTVLTPTTEVIIADVADGHEHKYTLVPKCFNGKYGQPVEKIFQEFGCPYIAKPALSATVVNNATCPYNLADLVTSAVAGTSVEWHNANNTNANSIIADPTNVGTGTYYAFVKNGIGCYSESVMVNIICVDQQQCTAAQNLGVQALSNGFLVHFQSAAYPPPSNSYTVRRRLTSDPDVSGSYSIIGSTGSGGVIWNASLNRWEILDTTALNNVEYTYQVLSNCGSTTPMISSNFSNYPSCPVVVGLNVTIQ